MTGTPSPARTRIPLRYSMVLLARGVAVWLLARIGVQALYAFIGMSARRDSAMAAAMTKSSPIILGAWTLVLSATLVRLDLHRRREIALVNNLGVRTSHAIVLGTLPAVLVETAMAILR